MQKMYDLDTSEEIYIENKDKELKFPFSGPTAFLKILGALPQLKEDDDTLICQLEDMMLIAEKLGRKRAAKLLRILVHMERDWDYFDFTQINPREVW